jgi:hypothetical protein
MRTEKTPAPSRKERKLLRDEELKTARERVVGAIKHAQYYEGRATRFQSENATLQAANAQLEQTRLIAAEGLLLERDELLTRVRRIEFRVQGLGFNL